MDGWMDGVQVKPSMMEVESDNRLVVEEDLGAACTEGFLHPLEEAVGGHKGTHLSPSQSPHVSIYLLCRCL